MSTEVNIPIPQLLEKMKNNDKDFRFMAINDLMAELKKDSARWDDELEGKIVKMILELLDDNTGEVQNQSVKCLGPLVGKIKDKQVEFMVDRLCNNMVGDKEQLRDISSIGLKTVIGELSMTSQPLAATICKIIVGRLSVSIAKQTDESVQLEALDILSDLLSRFGGLLVQYHAKLLDSLQPQLKSPRIAVRKRTIVALGYLVATCDQKLYTKIIGQLVKDLQSAGKNQKASEVATNTKTYIQAIGMVCKQAGDRFRDHVEKVVPLILKHATNEDEELKEQCLQACESIVNNCGKEVSSHIPSIVKISLDYVAYDPNYNYDDEEEDDEQMDCSDSDNDEEPEADYSDNEDMSWKVRKAAAKCLYALIMARPDLLSQFYSFSPDLIKRFKEREENVRSEIIQTYIVLLKQTKIDLNGSVSNGNHQSNQIRMDGSMNAQDNTNNREKLVTQVPLIMKALRKPMKENSVKTRQDCFQLLTALVSVTPNILGAHVADLVPWIQYSLEKTESHSNIKIETLGFLQHLIQSHESSPPKILLKFLPAIITGVKDSFYKISSEALLILTKLVRVIAGKQVDLTQYANDIYQACLDRMMYTETQRRALIGSKKIDEHSQEVEERAIVCMGQIFASLGNLLKNQLSTCLPRFIDLFNNERIRLTSIRSLNTIAGSSLCLDISPILNSTLQSLKDFLQVKFVADRDLKVAALELTATLVENHTTSSNEKSLKHILINMPDLVKDSDLHIAQLAIDLLSLALKKHRNMFASTITKSNLQSVFQLAASPLLQGAALNSLLQFFPTLITAKIPGLGYTDALDELVNPITKPSGNGAEPLQKHSRTSVAKCLASLVGSQSSKDVHSVVQRFLKALSEGRSTPHMLIFSLLAIAEIGKKVDLSSNAVLNKSIVEKFTHANEEVKSAASYALGCLSLGNLQHYLPYVLQQIETQSSHLYLLLLSLKEIISMQSSGSSNVNGSNKFLVPYIGNIWSQLFKHTECKEEGTRNIVAECLGKLCLIEPGQLLPKLQDALKSFSHLTRSTVLTAIKFMISDQPHPIDAYLSKVIGTFLQSLTDTDLNVKKMALVAFNSAAHNKPFLIKNLLPTVLPQLYNETIKRMELVRLVEMGPFKHEVDDGLDLRKAAFECMYTLLDTCFEYLDISEFLNHVQDGLKDHNDIKMLAYLMVTHLAKHCSNIVLANIDKLMESLEITIKSKLKTNALKQEHEKLDEVKRSAIKAITVLLAIQGADQNPKVHEVLAYITKTPQLNDFYEAAKQDSNNNSFARKDNSEISMDLN